MNILFSVDYKSQWGQSVYICGSLPELGNNDESQALRMECCASSWWQVAVDIQAVAEITYFYLIKDQYGVLRREGSILHKLHTGGGYSFQANDVWMGEPAEKHLYSSAFTDGFFRHEQQSASNYPSAGILLKLKYAYAKTHELLVLCGESDALGGWNESGHLPLTYVGAGEWQLFLEQDKICYDIPYKFAIYDNKQQKIVHWWNGENLILQPLTTDNTIRVETHLYTHTPADWKAAGVAIPVFSLRTADSFGIGDFSDLRKMVDWSVAAGLSVIQILPVNDTTVTHSLSDSYPYSAISIYALHPIYLGLKDFPLHNRESNTRYASWAAELNKQVDMDYEAALRLKQSYLKELFDESGDAIFNGKAYKAFYDRNEEWLFPYACFCYLRDHFHTGDYSHWNEYAVYDGQKLRDLFTTNRAAAEKVYLTYFTQYLLDKQLKEVREYALQRGVILKGDIPIGVNRKSVDTWVEPHLFNLDTRAGAPPDDFSVNGQNWGFPTYNWDEMAKVNYSWWTRRFRKMADYFDAYRIDHILGFFRIWEIPVSSVQGLLGYFNPALPYSAEELAELLPSFSVEQMAEARIHKKYLNELFGHRTPEVTERYLYPLDDDYVALKEYCNTQVKIQELFAKHPDNESLQLRDGLFALCNDVLFVRDRCNTALFHPRISACQTFLYRDMQQETKAAFDQFYNDFFYRRHSRYWADNAMKKLPSLIASTRMLVCGEDLGMIPDCVPSVMNYLQIFSLEIERMPKDEGRAFADLHALPYHSVCTTSTHDMSPIRLWWRENRDLTQQYYNTVLWKEGIAPEDCSADVCRQILMNNLSSPAMLAIIPLQDWLSINDRYKHPNPDDERINIPTNPRHYWRYRMHLNIEDLIAAEILNDEIKAMLDVSSRNPASVY